MENCVLCCFILIWTLYKLIPPALFHIKKYVLTDQHLVQKIICWTSYVSVLSLGLYDIRISTANSFLGFPHWTLRRKLTVHIIPLSHGKIRWNLCIWHRLPSWLPFQIYSQLPLNGHLVPLKWTHGAGPCRTSVIYFISLQGEHLSKADTWSWSLPYFSHLLHLPPRRTPL